MSFTHSEENKIVLGNKGRWTNYEEDNVVLNLKWKCRDLSSSKAIVCAEYSLPLSKSNSKYWVINLIMSSNRWAIRDFLKDFALNEIITDEEYIATGLYHKCHFQNRLQAEQDELDKGLDLDRTRFRRKMEEDGISILEDEDLLISSLGSSLKRNLPDIKKFRYNRRISDFEVSILYCINFNIYTKLHNIILVRITKKLWHSGWTKSTT